MRITQVLRAQHIGHMFKKHWKVQGTRVPYDMHSANALKNKGLPVIDALEFVKTVYRQTFPEWELFCHHLCQNNVNFLPLKLFQGRNSWCVWQREAFGRESSIVQWEAMPFIWRFKCCCWGRKASTGPNQISGHQGFPRQTPADHWFRSNIARVRFIYEKCDPVGSFIRCATGEVG